MTVHSVATAGHVDHGKSTLVRALTGVDPDRLAEEKRRGLTIELGFARMDLGKAGSVDLIDVPGHIRFMKTMLAGVGAVRAAVLVVAATEGWMPQTEEHLAILDLLGIESGVVVVTMADRVDGARVQDVIDDVDHRRGRSRLASAPIVVTDAVSGRGLQDLRDALADLIGSLPPAVDRRRARLWIDRSFSRAGTGTVVTGTLLDGSLRVGDAVELLLRGRTVRRAKVRRLESFGTAVDQLAPGRRAAVGLSDVARGDVERGDVLMAPQRWHVTERLDVQLRVLESAPRAVRNDGSYVVHLGTGEHEATVRLLSNAPRLEPGEEGVARLRLAAGVPLLPGDRFVLRDSSRSGTLGGGQVLDVAPVLRPSRAQPDRSVDRVVAERGWVEVDELERLTGEPRQATVGRWVVSPTALEHGRERIAEAVDRAGAVGLDVALLDDHLRALATGDGDLRLDHGRLLRNGSPDKTTEHPFLLALEAAPFAPPDPKEAGVPPEIVRELVRRGAAVREGDLVFASTAIDQAANVVSDLLVTRPEGVTVSEVRQSLGSSRRYTLALLSCLDRTGRTRRRGDLRVAGPVLERMLENRGPR